MNNLKIKATNSIAWSFLGKFLNQFFTLVFGVILARILKPSDFGLLTMPGVFVGFAVIFTDLGFSNALIQKKKHDDSDLNTVFWTNMILGVIFFVIFFWGSRYIADFYNVKILKYLTRIISISFVLQALVSIYFVILTKELNFKTINIIQIISYLSSSIITILLALSGLGVWSLALRPLFKGLFDNILARHYVTWRPKFEFDLIRLKSFLRFGINVSASRFLGYWGRQFDNLLIGKFLGQMELGIYNKSYQLFLYPINNVANTIRQVLFPSFSIIQENLKRVKKIYLLVIQSISIIIFPFISLLWVFSFEFVLVLLGEKWLGMVPIMKTLLLVALPQSILTLGGTLYVSLNRTDIQLKINLIYNPLILISFYIGLKLGGLMGLVYSYVVINIISFFPLFILYGRLINMGLKDLFNSLKLIILFSILIIIITTILNNLLIDILNPIIRLLAGFIIGIGTYLTLLEFNKFKIPAYMEIKENIKRYQKNKVRK